MAGEDFGEGFAVGAETAAIGFISNETVHRLIRTVEGEVSMYADSFDKGQTCIGQQFRQDGMTAATRREWFEKPELRKGVWAKFESAGYKPQRVRVNDYVASDLKESRVLDVSRKAMTLAKGIPYNTPLPGVIQNATVTFFHRY